MPAKTNEVVLKKRICGQCGKELDENESPIVLKVHLVTEEETIDFPQQHYHLKRKRW